MAGPGCEKAGAEAPGSPVNGGSRVAAEARPVNGGFRVTGETGLGARALLTGARGGGRAGRASRGRRRLTFEAPCPGLRPRKWRVRGTAAAADTGTHRLRSL
jgi:hypothetical protein